MGDPLARGNAFFLLKGAAKVRKAAVADLQSGFGDVATSGCDQCGGAVNAGAANPEHERSAGDLGEGAAEVMRAATDLTGEGVKIVSLVEIFEKMSLDAFNPFASGALGSGEEI
jgi:hypothetical protein